MKKLLILLFSILIFGSCTTNYFLCETAGPVKLYTSPDTHSTYIEIPVGKSLISTGKYKKYRKAKFVLYLIGNLTLKHLRINIHALIIRLIIQNISISQNQQVELSK